MLQMLQRKPKRIRSAQLAQNQTLRAASDAEQEGETWEEKKHIKSEKENARGIHARHPLVHFNPETYFWVASEPNLSIYLYFCKHSAVSAARSL